MAPSLTPPISLPRPPPHTSLLPPTLTTFLAPTLWLLTISALTHHRSPRTRPIRILLTFVALILAVAPFTSFLTPQPVSQPRHPQLFIQLPTSVRQVGAQPPEPLPSNSPSPSPPAPSPPPTTGGGTPPTVASPVPSAQGTPVDSGNSQQNQDNGIITAGVPPLEDCSGGLKRMQVVLLIELCFEILFLFLRCFAERDDDDDDSDPDIDVSMRGYIFVRAIYTVPVLGLNGGIYWIGGGPTGACLSNYSALQVPFTHLIFYAIYCTIIVILGVYRIDNYGEKDTTSYTYSSSQYRSDRPPTRTSSYFRGRSRHRHDYTTSTSSYTEPKFRVNLGCCELNF